MAKISKLNESEACQEELIKIKTEEKVNITHILESYRLK